MNIRLQIHIPENPTKAEKELYQQLRDIKGKSKKHFWQ
jgi:hypothetical protein